jgi:uncharacterized protein (TIGR02453 family)
MAQRIKKETLAFLRDLKRNNDREWFAANKDRYLDAHDNFLQFVQGLIFEACAFDKSVVGLDAKKTVFRIYRDTRFAKDKSPYKPNFGAHLIDKGKAVIPAGYYLHLEAGDCFLAGGIHMPESTTLRELRKEISAEGKEFLKIINDKEFKKHFTIVGDQLQKVPQGFDREDPMGDYLKFKEYTIIHSLSDKDVLSENFSSYCNKVFKLMLPFNSFMNRAISAL